MNPCDCSKVTAFLNHFGVLGAHQNRIQFVVHAELTCTPGTGTGCRGELGVRAPRRAKFVSPGKGKRLDLSCEGDCDRATELHRTLRFKVRHAIKANRTVRIRTSLICLSPAGVPRPGKVVTMAVRFGEHGSVDYEKSDLNGDGKPDKGQLR